MGFSGQESWSGIFPGMGFSRQEYFEWDLPCPEIEPASLASAAWAGRLFTTVPPWKPRRQFAGVLELRDTDMGRLYWIICVSLM